MTMPSEGTASASGANPAAAIGAATEAAFKAARDWVEDIKDEDFWTDMVLGEDKTVYFNVILDLEKPTEKENKAKCQWKVMGSTSATQNRKMPKGKTHLIGPAAPAAAGKPPNDPCKLVFVENGDIAKATHESRSTFVADALDAVKNTVTQYQCADDCGDLRADLHVKLSFIGYSDPGVRQWVYKTHWALWMFCYEDERKKKK